MKTLEGIRVLDLGSYIAGPLCCMFLADHGADVIRAEPPDGKVDRAMGPFSPDGEPITYGLTVQRNKKNITLNLRSERGKKLFDELVGKMDVVVHNYPVGTVESALLDYERLSNINPKLVLTAISGFGQNGPYARRLCFDPIAQAMSGAMSITGFAGMPPLRAGVPFVDFNTAARAALGTMFALYERNFSGLGQLVDIALFDVAFSMTGTMGCAAEFKLLGEIRKPVGNCSFYAYAFCGRAADGYVMISLIGNGIWKRMCSVLNRKDLIGNPRFKDNYCRYRNYQAIDLILSEWIKDKSVSEVLGILDKANIPAGPVNDISSALEINQIGAREMLVELDYPGTGKIPVPGVCIKLSRTPGKVERRASFLGEDNEAIYCGLLDYDRDELLKLKQQKVI